MTEVQDIIKKLQENDTTLTTSELLDQVIAIQLQKINHYNEVNNFKMKDTAEDAMKNLIELLKIREKFFRIKTNSYSFCNIYPVSSVSF